MCSASRRPRRRGPAQPAGSNVGPGRRLSLEQLEPRQLLAGEGLSAWYFDNADFTALTLARVDATVDFDWGTASPVAGVANTTYSVRWTGAVVPEFSELYTFTVTADDGVRLWIDNELIITNWVNQSAKPVSGQIALRAGQPTAVKLEYYQNLGVASVRLEWSSPSRPREVIPQARLQAVAPLDHRGTALQETWTGIGGGKVTDLTGSAAYAGPPTSRQMITSLTSLQQNVGDFNGSRIRGFIVPSFTGPHVFSVAGNDDVQLSLSTDADPANASRIAYTSAITAPNDWTKTTTQTSAPIGLVQGRRYYFEVLHKEQAGFNHWSVGWTTPVSTTVTIIGADNIEPWDATRPLPASGILDGMSTGRDRMLASPEMFARAKALVAQGGQFRAWYDTIIARADLYLTEDLPPATAPTAAAGGTQPTLAGLEDNLTYLAGAYRLRREVEGNDTNARQYFEKAKATIERVIQWSTWDTGNQFLGAAMVSQGISLCYDWMYDAFTAAERQQIADRVLVLAIQPAIDTTTARNYWTQWYGNWAFVCIGGVGSAALAFAPEYHRAAAETLIARGWPVLQSSMQRFAGENGGWPEGPGYLGYGTLYLIRFMSNLQTAVGTDFGLSLEPGFQQVPNFLVHASTTVGGNVNATFPFGNGDWSQNGDPWFSWLAARFNRGDVAKVVADRATSQSDVVVVVNGVETRQRRPSFQTPWALLWYDPRGDQATGRVVSPGAAVTRTDAGFYGDPALRQWGTTGQTTYSEHVHIWRDSWSNHASSVMFKGGYKGVDAHENLDGGTFIFDAFGQRWATDLGRDSYTLPKVGGTNYGSYRKRAEGQNTLVINPTANDYLSSTDANERAVNADQVYKDAPGKPAYAPVVKSLATDLESIGVVDLTNLYTKMRVSTVQRGFRFDRTDGSLLVQDEITATTAPEVYWFMHVPVAFANRHAQIAISPDGTTATITIGANRLECRILSGTGATFSLMEAAPLPSSPVVAGQAANNGVTKLTIHYTGTTNERLAVWMVPLKSGQPAPTTAPTVAPLVSWTPRTNRQTWAGDIDGYAAVSATDGTAASAAWTSLITASTGKAAQPLDSTVPDRIVPVTLSIPLGPGEEVTWARLVAGVRATSGTTTAADQFYLDSTAGLSYGSLGWGTLDTSATSRELTLSEAQLATLQDGTLDIAFSANTSVDWVQLQYTTVERGTVTVPAGTTIVDTTVRTGNVPIVKRGLGTLILEVAGTFTGGTFVEEGTLVVRHVDAVAGGPLEVQDGATVRIDVGFGTVPLASLTLGATGLVDIGIGQLTVAAGGFDEATIRGRLIEGRNGGTWAGTAGIGSSAITTGSNRAVGYRVSGGVLRMAWAAFGDANLDGVVNAIDVTLVNNARLFNRGPVAGVSWAAGDYNYNGRVDSVDMSLMNNAALFGRGSYRIWVGFAAALQDAGEETDSPHPRRLTGLVV